ncbi:MAG: leucine-rich repeat protein [Muribaculaceae bacterium]|nr:leucine-rich repeat protein [Muribaculaceae bacterium]
MKKFLLSFCAATAMVFTGCRYDDSDLWNSVKDLDVRVTTLEQKCDQMNSNIKALQTIVNASQNNDYITGVTSLMEDGYEIGYTITFAQSPSINIYHGKDGLNGSDGKDGLDGNHGTNGKDGVDGNDGYTPLIGIAQDSDGHYYWTLDGDWLLDKNGQKVSAEGRPGKDGANGTNGADGKDGVNGTDGTNGADGKDGKDGADGKDGVQGDKGDKGDTGATGAAGKDGITPKLKIEDGDWYVSTDNGLTWTYLGRATGEKGETGATGANGKDGEKGDSGVAGPEGPKGETGPAGPEGPKGDSGDSFFKSVNTTESDDYVIFILADGTEIKIPTWYAFENLKKTCETINSNVKSLQTIVTQLEAGDYVVSCTNFTDPDGRTGYTLKFAKGSEVKIYNGQDGKDGEKGDTGAPGDKGDKGETGAAGEKGEQGVAGADGKTPQISAKRDTDGILYWTLNGEFMTDESGKKIPLTGEKGDKGDQGATGATGDKGETGAAGDKGDKGETGAAGERGADGITPKLKISQEPGDDEEYWYVSYNNGDSWVKLGKARGEKGEKGDTGATGSDGKDGEKGETGAAGKDGDSIFSKVEEDDKYITITLADSGEQIRIPKNKPFRIEFDSEEFTVQPGHTYTLKYNITGGDSDTKINVYEKNGLKAKVNKTTDTKGTIKVTTPSVMTPTTVHELIVMVNDGNDRTLMETLTFVKGVAQLTNSSTIINSNETEVTLELTTNFEHYSIEIPLEAQSWLSVSPQTRATIRKDIIKFNINQNINSDGRSATIKIKDICGEEIESFLIFQNGSSVKTLNVTTDDHLNNVLIDEQTQITHLILSGTLNDNDYTFIAGMTSLKYLDLSAINNTSLPTGTNKKAGLDGSYESIILPENLTSIPDYCFFNMVSLKGDLIIPDKIKEIGDYAFYGCSGLSGNLVIGSSVTSIGLKAFIKSQYLSGTAAGSNVWNSEFFIGIPFNNIYCKALYPPSLNTTLKSNVSTTDDSGAPVFGSIGYCPQFLGIPNGSLSNYTGNKNNSSNLNSSLNSKWGYFPNIEEVDFEELGY